MNRQFFKSPKELSNKELKERIDWYKGFILETRQRRAKFEQKAEGETIALIDAKEDLEELKDVLQKDGE